MTKEICQDCGKVFLGGSNAFLCGECRKRRSAEAAKRGRNKVREKQREEALERVITYCGDIAEFTFREMPAEKKEALDIIHRWLYRVKKLHGEDGKEWGIRWGLIQNEKGSYYMDVMLWGKATDGQAEKEWGRYGLTKTLIKVGDQADRYDAKMWGIRQNQYEIAGGVIWGK